MASVDVETLMDQGFVAIRSAFSSAEAARCREMAIRCGLAESLPSGAHVRQA